MDVLTDPRHLVANEVKYGPVGMTHCQTSKVRLMAVCCRVLPFGNFQRAT
jgi:hypothetical protein